MGLMKIPKKIWSYCPSCRRHTEHTVRQLKKRPPRELSWGQRQFARVLKGYGSQPRSEQREFSKATKKTVLMLRCETCGKSHPRKGFRAKRVEMG